MTGGCLDEGRVIAFLDGTLSGDARSEVEAHVGACSACAELMTWAAADQAHRSRQAGREGRPFVGQLPPGSRVDRYQILGAVGRGGMGEVYAAYHPDLDRRIALKVVGESGADAPERRARLLREARAIARLSHPNVVSVHDAGTVGDRVYIAMEFVEGETVDDWLRARPRGWREVLDVFIAAARGLAAAHAAGVIHRDFKPQNVMVGKDGAVRVMDFGLARMAEEPLDTTDAGPDAERSPEPATVTKTGALVGTVAYMAPEQFRSEPLDARADQFSFCVALYEALHGHRPALAHLQPAESQQESMRTTGIPAWLRSMVARGLASDRERRFPSMDALTRALVRGRAGPRRHAVGAGAALAVALLAFGGWRAARGSRINCEVPAARLAAAWSGHDDARRQSVHRVFLSTGRPTAESSWQRVSRALDDYTGKWSAMYVDVCEATHVRGEQSGEVLDLRMTCLKDNLDQVRALADVFAAGDASSTANATMAVQNLPLLSRCDDLAALRSAIPPPRDPQTATTVSELRMVIKDVKALEEVGNFRAALEKARSIRPRVEATQYKPLLAELLSAIGAVEAVVDPARGESALEEAIVAANASRDDVTAAIAEAALAATIGDQHARATEGHRWARLAGASLDRTGIPHTRIRSWILHDDGLIHLAEGHFDQARELLTRAMTLKVTLLGKNHPDVARSLTALCSNAMDAGHPDEALQWCNRSVEILAALDPDSALLATATTNRGEALNALGRHEEATTDFRTALRLLRMHYGPDHPYVAYPLQGLAEAKIATGDPAAAISFLDEALRIREKREPQPVPVADTHFALARALWESGVNHRRARSLAVAAQGTYASQNRTDKAHVVATWLSTHRNPSAR